MTLKSNSHILASHLTLGYESRLIVTTIQCLALKYFNGHRRASSRIIQNIIRDEWKEATVITVAHRLNTIIDNDKIMVMDSGTMVEFETPTNLLEVCFKVKGKFLTDF